MTEADPHSFVSRGGIKLLHALQSFGLSPEGLTCADFGCNVGGFTHCLLRHGATLVYAVDTAYGTLAWTLRQDPRVVVLERTNALHARPPERVDLVVIDLGWTVQAKVIPAALAWLKPDGRLITLIKPHYEAVGGERRRLTRGVLDESTADEVARRVLDDMPRLGVRVLASDRSPIRGGHTKGNRTGNFEWLALLAPTAGEP